MILLGPLVTEAGYQAYFTSAADMVSNLQAAHLAGSALYKLRTYRKPSVPVIDGVDVLRICAWPCESTHRDSESPHP